MVAGPNGSGKTTLMRRLAADYAVNFYDILNADDIFAEVCRTNAYLPPMPVEPDALCRYAEDSSYPDDVKAFFRSRTISVEDDCVLFHAVSAVNTYTVALLTNFLQYACIRQGRSFSQETVFSHPSKVDALRLARENGYRTYLYFVSTDCWKINADRVAERVLQGGHDVPREKIKVRFRRSLDNLSRAFPYLSRAFFFDNSGDRMRYLAQWNAREGFSIEHDRRLPHWASFMEMSAHGEGDRTIPGYAH